MSLVATGVLSKALAEVGRAGGPVSDASEGYLEGARRHRIASKHRDSIEHGDIRRMRFDNGAFDAAVSTLRSLVYPGDGAGRCGDEASGPVQAELIWSHPLFTSFLVVLPLRPLSLHTVPCSTPASPR